MNANENYKNCTGSETLYRHQLFNMLYTEGVKELATDYDCYWLLDVVASYQTNKRVRVEGFQVWRLKRIKNDVFEVTAEDGNKNVIARQRIGFSDFKDDECTIWKVENVMMLPTEY